MLKFNNKNTWRDSGVFIVKFEHIAHLFLYVSIVDFEQVNVSWVGCRLKQRLVPSWSRQ